MDCTDLSTRKTINIYFYKFSINGKNWKIIRGGLLIKFVIKNYNFLVPGWLEDARMIYARLWPQILSLNMLMVFTEHIWNYGNMKLNMHALGWVIYHNPQNSKIQIAVSTPSLSLETILRPPEHQKAAKNTKWNSVCYNNKFKKNEHQVDAG